VVLPGGTPLPFVPCTGRQLYAAYLAWCRGRGIARPMQEGQFIGWVGSRPGWQAGRACATREAPGSKLFKPRKMVLPPPDALTRPDGVGVADWLTGGYFSFQAALDTLPQRPTGSLM